MLVETVLRTEDVPPKERFDRWREHLSRTHGPAEIHSADVTDFPASQRILSLGAMRVWTMEHPPMTVHRTPELIRQADPGLYHLSLPLCGRMRMTRPGREAEYHPCDLVLQDTSHPYLMRAAAEGRTGTVLSTGLLVPRELLPLPKCGVDRLIDRPMSSRTGIGALLAQFLTRLAADAHSYEPCDGPRLGTVAVDLLSALFAHALAADESRPSEGRRPVLALRIRTYIQEHLHDPQLTPPGIAAAHHISTSYLHRLFEEEDDTVATWIRHQRLERVRRDLADPALRSTPIHAVAARWGFPRAADFSRAFRAVYGLPPREYRHRALIARTKVDGDRSGHNAKEQCTQC
ncbi:helix-turn-helix domain-containing protein [Streptomyces sp. NPDC056930]|uniref:AraC-like ligand-binding domain-containing protein n=1 Tax=Streptomyces sp. NPDC056930 TaxID=3345967 RepID=UPI003635D15C